jgi:hypothetical protein
MPRLERPGTSSASGLLRSQEFMGMPSVDDPDEPIQAQRDSEEIENLD